MGSVLLRAYDNEVRPVPPAAREGLVQETDGPVLRTLSARGGRISYVDLGGLTGDKLDAFIRRQRDHFVRLDRPVDWITYTHDEPQDLPGRLEAAGFVLCETGTMLAGRCDRLASPVRLSGGLTIREIGTREDFERVAALQGAVWGIDASWLVPQLTGQHTGEPDRWTFLVAESGGEFVSAGWTRYYTDRFAMLYGGATLPGFQGRGIYRALVARRAQYALDRGREFVVVDASESSRPILQRLGLQPFATRVTYRWTPPRVE